MQVRHLVARDNVDDAGHVVDAMAVRHGSLRGRKVWALAGPIDPETHLNLDAAEHRLEMCVVVETFVVGAAVVDDSSEASDGEPGAYLLAATRPSAHAHRGAVDFGARRSAWLAAFRQRRQHVAQPA
jgi:hypothetical protein